MTYPSNPWAGTKSVWLLCFLCFVSGIFPSYLVATGPLRMIGSPVKFIAFGILFIGVIGFAATRNATLLPIQRQLNPGIIAILLFGVLRIVVWGAENATTSSDVRQSQTAYFLLTIAIVGLTLYTMLVVRTYEQRSLVLAWLLAGLAISCIVGLLQNLAAIDLVPEITPTGFINTPQEAPYEDVRGGATRARGTAGHPIEFAALTAVAVPLALHFARYAKRRRFRIASALTAVIALLAVPTGISRSGIVALLAVFLVYIWSLTVRQIATGIVVMALAIAIQLLTKPLTLQALWGSVTGASEDSSVLARVDRTTRVLDTFSEHPIFGLGPGFGAGRSYGILDNQWFTMIVTGGIVGLASMIVLTAFGFAGLASALRSSDSAPERGQAYALGAVFSGLIASSFTFDLFSFQQGTYTLFIVFGLLWSSYRSVDNRSFSQIERLAWSQR